MVVPKERNEAEGCIRQSGLSKLPTLHSSAHHQYTRDDIIESSNQEHPHTPSHYSNLHFRFLQNGGAESNAALPGYAHI